LSFAALPRKPHKLEDLKEESNFKAWMALHKKQYSSPLEYAKKFKTFKEATKRIEKLNKNSQSAVFGHTKFSDLTPEEFKATYLTYKKTNKTQPIEVLQPKVEAAPTQFDWRTRQVVTAVKDQGQCGSCWAFSATENIESVWMISKGISIATMPPLSPQQIVDCDTTDDGCGGGDTITAFQYVIKAGGLEPVSDYPYTAEDGTCNFQQADVYAKISNYKYATDPNNPNENIMQQNLYLWAPLSICVDASSWQNYNGGVLLASQCGTQLDHCVQAVGYNLNANPSYWIVRNSWGSSWGINGYILLQFGQDTCGCASEATTAVV